MKNVLIVDDTKNIRKLLTTCLELKGYTVTTAGSGPEALELILSQPFDLAFLDIKMPELSGTEVFRKIRALGFDFPVVIMTAFATVRNAVECTRLGAVAYLQKPFTVDKVNEVMKHLEVPEAVSTDADEYIKRSRSLIEESSYEEAFLCLKRALSIDPSIGEIYYLIGLLHERNGRQDEADKYFATAERFGFK